MHDCLDIIKIEGRGFARAQSELGQDHQNRIVRKSQCRRPIAGIENLLNFLWRQEGWQFRVASRPRPIDGTRSAKAPEMRPFRCK